MGTMEVVVVRVKCCDAEEAVCALNKAGMLHFRCVYCGFEVHAGSRYFVKWTPHHGVEVKGVKRG